MEDHELVERALDGDARAYGELVEIHQPRIYATLRKMTGDPDLAMDLTQDAFVRAWRQLASFQRRAAFSTWLYRIAVRLAYDAIEREKRSAPVGLEREFTDPAPDPEERVARRAEADELGRLIAALPDQQRAVVVLRAWDDLSYREIAEIVGTSETSARVSFHHAMTKLRAHYLEEAKSE